jgi:Lrp/AsnC family transcriptional regulator
MEDRKVLHVLLRRRPRARPLNIDTLSLFEPADGKSRTTFFTGPTTRAEVPNLQGVENGVPTGRHRPENPLRTQRDAGRSLDEIAQAGGAPPRPPSGIASARCARPGSSRQSTVLLDAEALGFEATFFVLIRTSEHEADWQRRFLAALRARPEVQEAHRLAGDIDYILKVRVRNARAYDTFYQALISRCGSTTSPRS